MYENHIYELQVEELYKFFSGFLISTAKLASITAMIVFQIRIY